VKNILIIASLYGSKRVLGLAKYLPEFGWSPTIITPPVKWQPTIISDKLPNIEGVKIIETDYRSAKELLLRAGMSLSKVKNTMVKNLLHFGGAIVNYPDSYSGWYRFALQAGREVLDKGDVDAIISICPITSHIIASQLEKEYGVKWICDSPDPWSQNPNYAYGRIRKWLDRRLERRTRANASALTAISELRATQLRRLHPGKPIYVITLGYDLQDYDTEEVTLTDRFTITYTGLIYPKKQNPELLLLALSTLIKVGSINPDDCEVRMYGGYVMKDPVLKYYNGLLVRWYGKVSHEEAVRAQKESQLLWLLDWDDSTELGVQPAKIFEYLGARRPILATGGVKGNVVDDLLKETSAGYHAISAKETQQVLLKCYMEHKSKGAVAYTGKESEILKYSQHEMAGKFARLLPGGEK